MEIYMQFHVEDVPEVSSGEEQDGEELSICQTPDLLSQIRFQYGSSTRLC